MLKIFKPKKARQVARQAQIESYERQLRRLYTIVTPVANEGETLAQCVQRLVDSQQAVNAVEAATAALNGEAEGGFVHVATSAEVE